MKKLLLYSMLFLASTQLWAVTATSYFGSENIEPVSTPNWDVRIYPNPNNGVFSVMVIDNDAAIEVLVFNVIGEKVFELTTLGEHGTKIDLSRMEKGLYFIQFVDQTGGDVLTRRMYIK